MKFALSPTSQSPLISFKTRLKNVETNNLFVYYVNIYTHLLFTYLSMYSLRTLRNVQIVRH